MVAQRVALMGPGKMGAPMGLNLIKAGHQLSVWARRPESAAALVQAGASFQPVPRELAGNDVIIDMLQDLSQLEPLLDGPDGLLAGVSAPTVLVVSSTVAPEDVRALAQRVGPATGGLLRVVDAPVSGGEAGAQAGTLSIMVGGDDDAVARAIPVLQACGTPVHCGPLGAGEVVKACNQMIVGITMAALSEAALIAEGAGVDVDLMFGMLSKGWGGSAVLNAKRAKVVNRDYSNTGAAKFMVKDLKIALSEAAQASRRLPLSSQALEIYRGLVEAGLGDDDLAVVHKYLAQNTTR
ncbi:MAG: NAD(P)-dependent oxidoreductase [Brooklawnia sp.]|uniref:NAD(P)-dependent oxidoreductase n=1 Tax=Brooklawnia sp. TaxID=2699740 RepID=UPI003C76993D